MEYTYSTKFKERTPLETIEIIKTFFESYGFTIQEPYCEALDFSNNCWRSGIKIFYDDIEVGYQQGKGISKDFCRASAYAEMYERFCNKLNIFKDERLVKLIQDTNFTKYGYYLNPDEKQGTLDDLISDTNIYNEYKCSKEFIQILTDNKFILEPYEPLVSQDINYYNTPLLVDFTGSNGMAAGNTLEEALVQGLSELFERQGVVYIEQNLNDTYHSIDLNTISNPILKKLIEQIEATGENIVILDLSYNFKFPVVAVCFINSKTLKTTYTFGSHPIFDIALERCLTEQYQDIWESRNDNNDLSFEISEYIKVISGQQTIFGTLQQYPSIPSLIPEKLIFNSIIEKQPSNVYYNSDDISNIKLLEYYKNLCIKNNLTCFYKDNSCIPNMYAVHIYIPEFQAIKLNKQYNYFSNTPQTSVEDIKNYYNFLQDFNFKFRVKHPMFTLFNTKVGEINQVEQILERVPNIDSSDLTTIYQILLQTFYKDVILKYVALYKYKYMGYSWNEIVSIFNFCNMPVTPIEYNECTNINWICKNILYSKFKSYFESQKLLAILRPFIHREEIK